MQLAKSTIALVLSVSSTVAAQQAGTRAPRDTMASSNQRPGDFTVRTVELHHLTSGEAVKLLAPYVQSQGGGVFEVPNVRAVTIREVPRIYVDMISVLEKYDREPVTVVLNFQLVSANQTTTRDPSVAGIDSLLRGVLKFSGYRLLGTAIATAGEDHTVMQTIAGDNETLSLSVEVDDVRVDGNAASVNLRVSLYKPAFPARSSGTMSLSGQAPVQLLSTGVTVPIGQTVLLGTSASENGQRALILTVRPQLAKR